MLNFETEVNGFTIEAKFTEAAVDEVFSLRPALWDEGFYILSY